MALKLVFPLLLSFLAFQASESTVHKVNGAFDEIIDFAEDILKNVTKVVNETVNWGEKEINGLLTEMEKVKENAQQYAQELVDAELAELNKLIDEYKNKVNGTAHEVLQCIEDVEGDISNLDVYAINASIACAEEPVANLVKDTLPILDDLQNVNAQIEAESAKLEKCKSDIIPIDCLKDVVNDLIQIVSQVPADIQKDVQQIEADFQALKQTVEQCVENILPTVEKDAEQFYADFAQCVEK